MLCQNSLMQLPPSLQKSVHLASRFCVGYSLVTLQFSCDCACATYQRRASHGARLYVYLCWLVVSISPFLPQGIESFDAIVTR